ncbi:hypothetical protein C8F01DRAFT_727007 [Mycena amicta]|nr:hypothetical protein C8F01DRAFT_726715 [Mycena amicta]KAJ7049630.1 hypothetical protein C8F01DRAFT_727007 [Mycena amicta]
MHNCLCIAEVLDNIFGHLGGLDYHERRSLAAVARTCKTFTDPALDVLWAEQSNLENLLKCLPSNCWQEIEFSGTWEFPFTTIKILRPLEADDWLHVWQHRRRVRRLTLYSWGSSAPQATLVKEIERSLPTALFPNLRQLVWWPNEEFFTAELIIRCLRLLLSPRLASLRLRIGALMSTSEIALLSALDTALPTLRCLDIFAANHSSGYSASFSAMALKLSTHLEELDLPTIDIAALRYLSVLPELSTLTLYSPRVGDIGTSAAILSTDLCPFPALCELHLSETSIGFALEMIASVENWELGHLEIGFKSSEHREMTRLLYVAIASHLSVPYLAHLWIGLPLGGDDITDPPDDTRADYAVTGEILRLLFCFRHITEVILQPPAGFLLDDSILSELARAWRNIVTLRLGTASSVQVRPIATLNALRPFAKYCKRLSTLTLAIDASTVPDFGLDRKRPVSQETLRHLDVEKSPIGDSAAVAHFVSGHFPAIESMDTFHSWRWDEGDQYAMERDEEEQELEYHKQWKEVEKMLPLCKAVREEERHWAKVESE